MLRFFLAGVLSACRLVLSGTGGNPSPGRGCQKSGILRRGLRSILLGFALFCCSVLASGEPRSELEESVIAEALAHYGWEPEEQPVGQEVEEIAVYVLEVFDDRDPIPNFVNVFHVRTRDWVVEQEVLLTEGEPWDVGRVLETERNLRRLRQVSLANIVAAKGSEPGKVRLLVVVKDVWSLRLNSNWSFGESGLDRLLINPAEENLAGLHASVGLYYQLERDRHAAGGSLAYPRVATSRMSASSSAFVYVNRETGEAEGTAGQFTYQRPLFSRHTRWGFGSSVGWNLEVSRQFAGPVIRTFTHRAPSGAIERIPLVWETESLTADNWYVRSFGVEWKHDLRVGVSLDHAVYTLPDLSEYSDGAVEGFLSQEAPVSDRRINPYVQLRSYRAKFHRVLNVESLGLQEDFQVGHDVSANLFAGGESLGSSRDLVGSVVNLGYTWPIDDGLLRVVGSNRIVVANEARHEGRVSVGARLVTPSFSAGRLHVDGILVHRYFNYLNLYQPPLGNDNRLRGYLARQFRGRDLVALNFEFRTKPVDILSAQVGGAAFLDIADAPSPSLVQTDLKAGSGIGLRVLFPQAERTVMRLDVAVPFNEPWAVHPMTYYFTFGQAFPMP